MATDSSFNDEHPDSVPTTPDSDNPAMDPDSPLRDPLARPNVVTPEHEPRGGDGIPDDDDMPLPND